MTFSEQEAELDPLVSALGSCEEAKRMYALARVSRLEANDRLRLMEKLLAAFDHAVVWEPQWNVLISVAAGLVCFGVKPCLVTVIAGVLIGLLVLCWRQSRNSARQLQGSLQALIAETGEARLVPLCLDRRWLKNGEYDNGAKNRSQAVRALILRNSLPLLQSRDADTWTQMRKENLLSILNAPFRDVEVTLCTLNALEKIGQASALKPVQFLAKMPLPYVMGCMPQIPFEHLPSLTSNADRIKRAAERVLPVIEARAREEQNPRILLRAAETPYRTPACELLRPAGPVQDDTPSEELLRPHLPLAGQNTVKPETELSQGQREGNDRRSRVLRGDNHLSHLI